MTWTRLDDRWTEQPLLARLSYETRWHYLAMIQFCSRTNRIDGVLTVKDAMRCSDVDDPSRANHELLDAGLLEPDIARLRIVEIHDHIPPPGVRKASEKAKIRMRRHRAHEAGDHSLCLPDHCSHAPVTGDVTRDPGTGRDRTGRLEGEGSSERIDKLTGEVFLSSSEAVCDHPLATEREWQRDMCNNCWAQRKSA
jgi:hypothetical protein